MGRVISRSSIRQYQSCPRAYYHKYLDPRGGPGLEGTDRPDYFDIGTAFHDAGELLLRGESGAAAGGVGCASASALGLTPRWQNWILAVCLAWERTQAEEFHSQYDVLSVEQDVLVPLTADVSLYGRADAVLQDRDTGGVYVWNWKTAADIKDWNKKFFLDIQSITEAIAVGEQIGIPVDGVIYGGVWKGPLYKGHTTSRLVGGYTNTERTNWSPDREKGLTVKFNAWEESFPFGEGIAAWVSWLPAARVGQHFAVSSPQGLGSQDIVEGWVRQITRTESDIAHVIECGSADDQKDFFAQHISDDCARCPYFDLCAGRSDVASLLDAGRLKHRDGSHLPKHGAQGGGAAAGGSKEETAGDG